MWNDASALGKTVHRKPKQVFDLKPTAFGLFPQMSPAVKRIALYKTALLYIASLSPGV